MRLAAFRTDGPVAVWLPLTALSLLLSAAAPTAVQAQGIQPPNPKIMQQTRQRLQQKPAPKQAAQAAGEKTTPGVVKRRDPFQSLLVRPEEVAGQPLPPGKRGLVIAQLTVNGVVATATGMIAVVTMRGRNRAYFLRQRDELFNGYVGRITEDGVIFQETTVDAFGKEYEREVVKQLSGSGAKR